MCRLLFLEVGEDVRKRVLWQGFRSRRVGLMSLCLCLFLFAACEGRTTTTGGHSPARRTPKLAARQVLVLPNVGTQDVTTLDPAAASDEQSLLAISMISNGLVRLDQQLNVIPDQATWTISPDRETYTFHLKAGLTFSDGTPITAATYVYSLTRALTPATQANEVMLFLGTIVGAAEVNAGTTTTLSGVQATDASTLVITLNKPTDYFLSALANPLAFAVNSRVISQYATTNWSHLVNGGGVGSGPLMVKVWQHNTKMMLVPNPHYYGPHTHLTEVDMIFAVDAHTAFQAYQGGQYSFIWNILPADRNIARGLPGFVSQPQLETDAIFFNTQTPPFNQLEVRQAFAQSIDKTALTRSVLHRAAIPAPTIIPVGIPGYRPRLISLAYSRSQAQAALRQAYPDISKLPPITFSYPNTLVSPRVASALQQMWQAALGIPIKMVAVETDAYNDELAHHQIPFGFEQWNADFPDPYDVLALNLVSTASGNAGQWQNSLFDQLVQQAEQTSGAARLDYYGQAEQIAISNVGLLPLDHQNLSAVIPPTVHGVGLSPMGLSFGDWSNVYLLSR